VNLGKNHPDYQTPAAEVASLRSRIAQETGKIAESMGNLTQINLRRESDLREALEAQKRKILELKREHDKLDLLQSDVQNAQHNLDTVTQRLAQSTLEGQLQQTNVLLLTSAFEPLQPSSPHRLVNLAVGMFLGGLLGVIGALVVELYRPRVRGTEDLAKLLSVPLLGFVRSAIASPQSDSRIPLLSRASSLLARMKPSESAH